MDAATTPKGIEEVELEDEKNEEGSWSGEEKKRKESQRGKMAPFISRGPVGGIEYGSKPHSMKTLNKQRFLLC